MPDRHSPLLLNEAPLQVLPSLASAIGLNQAIALQQVHYWRKHATHHEEDEGGTTRTWVYKSLDEWQDEFAFWSKATVRRTFKNLRTQGSLIVEQKRKHKGDPTNWYAIDYEHINQFSGEGPSSRLLIHEPALQVLPSLAEAIGLNEAIILQQIYYWCGRSTNVEDDAEGTERTWTYKTLSEWKDEFSFWSRSTIRRALKSLKTRGVVIAEQKRADEGDSTNWYAVNYEALESIAASIDGDVQAESQPESDENDNNDKEKESSTSDAETQEQSNEEESSTQSIQPAKAPTREAFRAAYDGDWNEDWDLATFKKIKQAPPVAMMFDEQFMGYFSRKLSSRHAFILGKVARTVTDFDAWYAVLEYWTSDCNPTRINKMLDRYQRTVRGEVSKWNNASRNHAEQHSEQASGVTTNQEGHVSYVPTMDHITENDILTTDAAEDLCKRYPGEIKNTDFKVAVGSGNPNVSRPKAVIYKPRKREPAAQ